VGTSHMSINQHMSIAVQRLVDFISMVTQQYITTQRSCNALRGLNLAAVMCMTVQVSRLSL
jgi:hypothetical protein